MKRFGYLPLIAVALWALFTLTGCGSVFKQSAPAPVPTPHVARKPTPVIRPKPVAGSAGLAVYATHGARPAGGVLVYAEPLDARVPRTDDPPAVLNLVARHFEPAVLPVRVGGRVTIQNLDGVAHDLYSFSHTRPLSLHLPAGARDVGLKFRHAGVVAIGCKIYNSMHGYVYVTAAPYFGLTDSNGYLRFGNLPAGRYRIGVWLPGSSDKDFPGYPRSLTLESKTDAVVHVKVRHMRPPQTP